MCWGVEEVRGDVGKGEVKEMWGSEGGSVVGTPHHNTLPWTSPNPLPTSFTHKPSHFPTHPIPVHSPTPLHFPHIFPCLHPHPNTLPYTSPHTPHTAPTTSPFTPTHFPTNPMHSPHIFLHSFDYVAKLPCDHVTLINLTGKAQ